MCRYFKKNASMNRRHRRSSGLLVLKAHIEYDFPPQIRNSSHTPSSANKVHTSWLGNPTSHRLFDYRCTRQYEWSPTAAHIAPTSDLTGNALDTKCHRTALKKQTIQQHDEALPFYWLAYRCQDQRWHCNILSPKSPHWCRDYYSDRALF